MPGKEKKFIAFALYPGVTPLDLVGPLTVLRDLKIGSPYRIVVVGERVEATDTDTPLQMIPVKAFNEVPDPFAVIVPGGGTATVNAMKSEPLLAYVRSAAVTAEVVGSTGNGALILAAAGLLEGRRAAIHWASGDLLQNLGATYARERWVEDGKFLTAAGGSAGIDMMLSLVAKLKGESRAKLTQLAVEYDPQPPFASINLSSVDREVAGMLGVPQGPEDSFSDKRGVGYVSRERRQADDRLRTVPGADGARPDRPAPSAPDAGEVRTTISDCGRGGAC